MKTIFLSLTTFLACAPALAQSDYGGDDIVITATRSGDGVRVADLPASITLISCRIARSGSSRTRCATCPGWR